jgi:hypothetical protein
MNIKDADQTDAKSNEQKRPINKELLWKLFDAQVASLTETPSCEEKLPSICSIARNRPRSGSNTNQHARKLSQGRPRTDREIRASPRHEKRRSQRVTAPLSTIPQRPPAVQPNDRGTLTSVNIRARNLFWLRCHVANRPRRLPRAARPPPAVRATPPPPPPLQPAPSPTQQRRSGPKCPPSSALASSARTSPRRRRTTLRRSTGCCRSCGRTCGICREILRRCSAQRGVIWRRGRR